MIVENTNFRKKPLLPIEKLIKLMVSRIIKFDKPQGTTNKGYTKYFDKFCASYEIIPLGFERSREKLLKNCYTSSKKKDFCPF